MHEGDAVAAQRLVHEVRRNEDRDPLIARQVDQDLPEAVSGDGVDARSGLVQDQHLGLVDDGHGERQALANAERKPGRQVVGVGGETEAREQSLDPPADLRRRQVEQPGVEIQVLPDRELCIKREALRHVADPFARRQLVGLRLFAEQPGPTFRGRQQARQHFHRRGLAAAVRAQEAEDFPTLDLEADPVHGREVPEASRQPLRDDGGPVFVRRARGNLQGAVAAAQLFRQETDEGVLQALGPDLRLQLRRAADGEQGSSVHRDQPVETLGLVHVGRGHQHRHVGPLGAQPMDQIPELTPREGIDAGGGLIQNQQLGVVDQRTAEPQFLLHAAGELADRSVRKGIQPRAAQQVANPSLTFPVILTEQPAEELQVLHDREVHVEILAETLRHVGNARTDPAAMPSTGHVAAQGLDAAGLQLARAGNQGQQRRLADAVRADQPDGPAAGNLHRNALERQLAPIAVGYALQAGSGFPIRIHRAAVSGRRTSSQSGQTPLSEPSST